MRRSAPFSCRRPRALRFSRPAPSCSVSHRRHENIECADILGKDNAASRMYCPDPRRAGPRPPRAQPPTAVPTPGQATFIVFAGGRDTGREQVALSKKRVGWTITSTSRLGPPLNITTKRFEVTMRQIGTRSSSRSKLPSSRALGLSTSFGTTTAISEISQNGVINSKTDQISARTVVLPNNFFAAYEALAVRLAAIAPGAEIPIYVAPAAEIRMLVKTMTPSTYQTPEGSIQTRQYAVTFQNIGESLEGVITVDARNRFAKLELPAAGLVVVRQDLAGVATRQQTLRNPTDTDQHVPATGFSLAATLTTPQVQGRLRHPAVVLVAGSIPVDRDAVLAGIPLFAQLAQRSPNRPLSCATTSAASARAAGDRDRDVEGLRRRRGRRGGSGWRNGRTSTTGASLSPVTSEGAGGDARCE